MSQDLKTLFTGKVTVVGDVMLDSYWKGPSSRISPEAPVPVVKVQDKEERAGGAAKQVPRVPITVSPAPVTS